jgi:hypothetical protein
MSKLRATCLVAALTVSCLAYAGQESDPPKDNDSAQTQASNSDASINRQILQTLTDIRDSQLSVLQAQIEILSILRSQEKGPAVSPTSAPVPDAVPTAPRRTVLANPKPRHRHDLQRTAMSR